MLDGVDEEDCVSEEEVLLVDVALVEDGVVWAVVEVVFAGAVVVVDV